MYFVAVKEGVINTRGFFHTQLSQFDTYSILKWYRLWISVPQMRVSPMHQDGNSLWTIEHNWNQK